MSEFACDQPADDSKPPHSSRQAVLSAALWILSIVCVCLTATNLYLLVWVWTNLSLSDANSIDLMGSGARISLAGQLRTKQPFRAALIGGAPAAAGPASTLSLQSPRAIHLVGAGQQHCAHDQCDTR